MPKKGQKKGAQKDQQKNPESGKSPQHQKKTPPYGSQGATSTQQQQPPEDAGKQTKPGSHQLGPWGDIGPPQGQQPRPQPGPPQSGPPQPGPPQPGPPQQSFWGQPRGPQGQQQRPPQPAPFQPGPPQPGPPQPGPPQPGPPQQSFWGQPRGPQGQQQRPPQPGPPQPGPPQPGPPQQSFWGQPRGPQGQQQRPPQPAPFQPGPPQPGPPQPGPPQSGPPQPGSPQPKPPQSGPPQEAHQGAQRQRGPGGRQQREVRSDPQQGTPRPKSSGSESPEGFTEFAPRITAPKKSGKPIVVYSNFFKLIIKDPNIVVFHYDVIMEPDKPKFLLRPVWNKFMSTHFPQRLTGFDGKNAYSKGPLLNDETFTATVSVINPENNREKEFNVTINKVRTISFNCFQNYREKMLSTNNLKVLPEAEIAILEIIMKSWACDFFVGSGRSFFPPAGIDSKAVELSRKLEMKFGFFQSAFLGYIPYLNFDISHKAFYRSCSVLDVLDDFRQRNSRAIDVDAFNHFIRNAKVEYELPNDSSSRRVFRVNKLANDANKQKFKKEEKEMTVADYFATEKNCRLRHPELPVLWVGPHQKTIYLPMEFCKILPNQIYSGIVDPMETRQMVQKSTSNAIERFKTINDTFRKVDINSRPLLKEFGLSVADQMEQVPARILPPPTLRTLDQIRVNEGVWRIRNFLEPVALNKWCVLNTDKYTRRENIVNLQNTIKSKGNSFNMKIESPCRDPVDVEPSFAALKRAFSQLKDMEIVFVIISEAKGLYSRIKTICETQEGVLTQCIKSRTVSQDPRKLSTTIENILLKVNSKLGGKNHCLNVNSMPKVLEGYTMVVGADVTHSSPGMKIPSVAAVAASCDPAAFQYGITVRVQPKGEMIRDLQEIMKIHLKKFFELRKRYPEKIIFFRDGVSEGELPLVLKHELTALRNACNPHCQPKITLLIVQKRHHARFFPTRREDEQGRNFNVPVGTCVDSQIVHPRDLDFFLLSHASILGTARPTRYRLLHDDNKLTDEEIENLSYYLCHLFSRCNRSVSYPSPTYNAHLAAFRGRAYLEGLNITDDCDISAIQKKMTDNISRISPMFFV